jgi:hypothetical protein
MTRDEFKNHLKKAAANGKLLTPKHDPNNLKTTFSKYRTVISFDLASKLDAFIDSGAYAVTQYENVNYPQSPLYFEITPGPESGFLIPASGVAAAAIFPSSVVDRLVVVFGNDQGCHMFGEDSSEIKERLIKGDLANGIQLF